MEHYRTIPQGEWLISQSNETHLIAIDALEKLIKDEFSDISKVRLLEVGPVPVSDILEENHIAPISIFKERNPQTSCLAYGLKLPSNDILKKQILDNVEIVQGILAPEYTNESYFEELFDKLGGAPNVIFGQYVFTGNNPSSKNHPVGVPKVFEASAKILEKGGYIVIDNIGISCSFGIQEHWEHSSKMKMHSIFSYEELSKDIDDPFVYAMQKRI